MRLVPPTRKKKQMKKKLLVSPNDSSWTDEVAAEYTDKTAFSALCGHQLVVELKSNDKNEIEDQV